MHIGIIGTKRVALALATRLTAAGHEVVLVSRSPEEKSGLPVPVRGLQHVASAELVINAAKGSGTLDTLAEIGAQALAAKVLLDVANAVGPDLRLLYPDDSLAQRIQSTYPDTRVVKSLNTMNSSVMVRPEALSQPTTVFLSGNDARAKETVSGVLCDLGWAKPQQLDLGGIETARAVEHYFYLSWTLGQAQGTPAFNVAVIR